MAANPKRLILIINRMVGKGTNLRILERNLQLMGVTLEGPISLLPVSWIVPPLRVKDKGQLLDLFSS